MATWKSINKDFLKVFCKIEYLELNIIYIFFLISSFNYTGTYTYIRQRTISLSMFLGWHFSSSRVDAYYVRFKNRCEHKLKANTNCENIKDRLQSSSDKKDNSHGRFIIIKPIVKVGQISEKISILLYSKSNKSLGCFRAYLQRGLCRYTIYP